FAFSLGPVVWTVINEIFPNRVRGRAVAVATAVNRGSAWLVRQIFLTLLDGIGTAATFWLLALVRLVAYVWIFAKVPETKGRTLEEIEASWGLNDGQGPPARSDARRSVEASGSQRVGAGAQLGPFGGVPELELLADAVGDEGSQGRGHEE